ncbi:MAG: tetratricopeptide repeat protein [Candidatus Paceibacterota bacterium]
MSPPLSSVDVASNPQPRLSLCMIVRDAERTLEPCLESIRPWVDELVVVDTGSVDSTVEIAKGLGARLYHFPWCDDFSAARNVSLEHAEGEWLFWMDADDTIDEASGRKLRELADGPHDSTLYGYVLQVHCPGGDDSGDSTVVDHVKLFRNLRELRFEGRIHEQILPAIRRAGGDVGWTDIFVTHSGSDQSPEGRRKKHDRDLRILHLEHQERPDHPFVLFNLGMTYADMEQHEKAVGWLRQSIDRAQPTESHLRKAFAILVSSLHQLGRRVEAEEACERALTVIPDDPELLFRRGMLAHESGQLQAAVDAYHRVLSPHSDRYFASLDSGVIGAKAHHNLACVYADLRRLDLAEIEWRRALEAGGGAPAHRSLVETLIQQRRFTAAAMEIAKLESAMPQNHDAFLLRARLEESQGRLALAREQLQEAIERHPNEATVWESLGRFLFEHGEPGDAVAALAELARLEPQNGATWHNLGLAQLRAGEAAAAVQSLEQSLQVRPDSDQTEMHLKQAKAILQSNCAAERIGTA